LLCEPVFEVDTFGDIAVDCHFNCAISNGFGDQSVCLHRW